MSSTLTDRAARTLGFTSADLRANQQGRLTESQRDLAQSKYRSYVRNGLIALLVMWLIFTALLVGSLIAQGSQPEDMRVLPYVIGAMTAIFVLVGIGSLWHGRDLRDGRVRSVEGVAKTKVATYQGRYSRSTGYELTIGGQKFRLISQMELAAFQNGSHYRVYYIRYAPLHVLLSAESLDAPS